MIFTESDYEKNIINSFVEKGFKYFNEEEMVKMRGGINKILLFDIIEKNLIRINEGITKEQISKVIFKLKDVKSSDLLNSNILFQNYVTDGVKIHDEKQQKTITVKIFDGNDEWFITNQFKMPSLHQEYNNQYPDIVLYCNGIPVIVFELKGLKESDNLEQAYNQIKNYQEYLPDLFKYNFFNVIANVSEMKFGSITSQLSRYQYWRGKDFSNIDPYNLINDMFDKGKVIDLIKNFTFFTNDKSPVKIISSYHQYYGTKNAIDNSIMQINKKDKVDGGKAGIFWHTQGSGKSYSMLFLVKNVAKQVPGTTFLIVTDRNDLDNQLFQTFSKSEQFIGQKIHQIESIKNLKEELFGRKQDGVYFTTVQKFNNEIGELSQRDNILVIVDEAHRSHTNIEGIWEFDKEEEIVKEKFGNARFLRDSLPNATFIGFTGTPIENDDKSTTKIFGDIITKYLMIDAERDGVVVPIRYESRKAELSLNLEQLERLNSEYNEVIDSVYENSSIPSEVQKKINKSLQEIKNVISDPERIDGISRDFVNHYKSRSNLLKGKAMFVAFNRHVAFEYYKKIIEIAPDLKDNVKLIITNSNNQSDPHEMLEVIGNSEYRKRMATEFKKDDSDFKIAIVVDMWLTGFDVPSLDVIYLDKPIKMHNLMQTVARTNRVYTKGTLNKEYGLVVDYIGLWTKLNEALAFYSSTNEIESKKQRNLKELKPEYIKAVDEIINIFNIGGFINTKELVNSQQERINSLKLISSEIIKNKEQQEYISKTKKVNTYFKEVVSILNEEERMKFQMLIIVRSHLINIELGNIDIRSKTASLKKTLESVIEYDKTTIINSIEGDAILISDIVKFINGKLDEDAKDWDIAQRLSATRKLITKSKKINIRKSEDLFKKLTELLNRYDNNFISLEELFEGIKAIAKEAGEMNDNLRNESGYSQEELAFYNIISGPLEELGEFDKGKVNEIMKELLDIINNDEKVNDSWIYNDLLVSKIRGELKILLLKHGYPPEDSKSSSKDIVEQIMYQKNYKEK